MSTFATGWIERGIKLATAAAALAAAAFLVLVVADEDSFDGIDDLPASP